MIKKVFAYILGGEEDKAIELIEQDPSLIEKTDEMGRTLLMESAIFKRIKVCKYLIDHGANINAKELKEWTALHFAANVNCFEIVEELVKHGADINAQEWYGNTPLHRSILSSRHGGEIIKFLIKNGADADIQNKSGIPVSSIIKRLDDQELRNSLGL